MDSPLLETIPTDPRINLGVYLMLPPKDAQYQLQHINDSGVTQIAASQLACICLAFMTIVLRFISRGMTKTGVGADDWFMLAAFLALLGFVTIVLLCTWRYHAARHAILLTEPIKFAQAVLVAEGFYGIGFGCVKLSTLLLYRRIFPSQTLRGLCRFLWAIGITVVLCIFGMELAIVFQCHPIQGAWNPLLKAKCVDINKIFMGVSGANVATDLALLIVPLPHLWRLQIPLTTKIQLLGIFSMGGFVTIISIYRIPILHNISLIDGSWTNIKPSIWTTVEVSMAIVAASALTLKPLFNWVFGRCPPIHGKRFSTFRRDRAALPKGVVDTEDSDDSEFDSSGHRTPAEAWQQRKPSTVEVTVTEKAMESCSSHGRTHSGALPSVPPPTPRAKSIPMEIPSIVNQFDEEAQTHLSSSY